MSMRNLQENLMLLNLHRNRVEVAASWEEHRKASLAWLDLLIARTKADIINDAAVVLFSEEKDGKPDTEKDG